MVIHRKLPEGAWKARTESEFYRLKHRKRVLYEDNRELKEGLRYLIWSRYARAFYERLLDPRATTEDDISYYQLHGLLFLYPTEENKEEIREDVAQSQLGYWLLMERRQAEMNYERKMKERNNGDGYQYQVQLYKRIKDKYKIKKSK